MSNKTETKTLSVEVKEADEGIVIAQFATLGVKDLDGDVIATGAFGEQTVKVSAFGHESWKGALPVGTGTISEDGDAAIAKLNFFMNTTHGRDHFETVKGLGDLGEWSFGFDITDRAEPDDEQKEHGVNRILKGLTVHEVSPVFRGAGVGTQTLAVKAEDDPPAVESDPDPEPEPEVKTEEPDALKEQIAAQVGRYELLRRGYVGP